MLTQLLPAMHTETIHTESGQRISFRMLEVLGGGYNMGADDKDAKYDEKPIHRVNVPTFWMGEFPVTQNLWQAVLGENPSAYPGLDRPVERVSWLDITERFLPILTKLCRKDYRLPTEAEWEYAARGGKYQSFYLYSGSNRLKDVAWYGANSYGETKTVGLKQPNVLGLYDLSGNVYEWCADYWHSFYLAAPNDGSAWIEVDFGRKYRIFRGGSWFQNDPSYCRVSYRGYDYPWNCYSHIGFRLVLSIL